MRDQVHALRFDPQRNRPASAGRFFGDTLFGFAVTPVPCHEKGSTLAAPSANIRAHQHAPVEQPPHRFSGPCDTNGSKRIDLTTTLYGDLRKLAAARMAGQYGPQTLQATALVHEAWLRLGGDEQPEWNDRTHFFAAVAGAMRHIFVDRARRRKRIRHGGGLQRIDIDAWNWELADPGKAAANDEAILMVNGALEEFAAVDPQTAELINLHFFAGLTISEAAEVMGLAVRTTKRRIAYARAWLGREIRRGQAA